MSLRAFHVIFVLMAEAVLVLFAWWGLTRGGLPALGMVSCICAVLMLVYGVLFFRKLFQLRSTV